jgi:RNA polymerase-interacting CarD/CdnL/TRCF family regulator
MTFRVGDPIMHWMYGLGNIIALEERVISEVKKQYYAVSIKDLTVWVPVDDNVDVHLRPPTVAAEFKRLLATLAEPGESLPDDQQERKLQILDQLKDGRAESLCQVISSLSSYQKIRALNQADQSLMKRARNSLLGEWTYVLTVSLSDAEKELHRLLESGLSKTQGKA